MPRLYILFGCILLLVGCREGDDTPATVPVTGLVRLNGTPLDKGSVTFLPANLTAGEAGIVRPSTAELKSDGTFVLSTFKPGDGALSGEYKVTIISYSVPPGPENPGGAVWAIPRKYGDAETSGLTATIPEGDEPQNFTFKLTGEPDK